MIGGVAEDFTLKDQEGNEFNLYQNLDKKVLLVFYPKDNSPVCTKQLSNYGEFLNEFAKRDIKVVGINKDNCKSHKEFCSTIGNNITLLCDESKNVSKKFSALNIIGMNKRKLVLIGTDKRILLEESIFPVRYIDAEKIFEMIRKRCARVGS